MLIITGLFLLALGTIGGYQLAHLPKLKIRQQHRAIQEHFAINANDYTYFYEGTEDGYILSTQDTEYRIKFSTNTPMTVVYAEVLSPVLDEE